jgi:glucose/arabinose dehydrogenase/plastocyanin
MRKLAIAAAVTLAVAIGVSPSRAQLDAPVVNVDGFATAQYATLHAPVSGMAFSPADGMMYVTVIDMAELTSAGTGEAPPANALGGGVWRLRPLPGGAVVPEPVALGGRVPLGLTFDPAPGPDGSTTLYYSDLDEGPLFGNSYGAVRAIDIAPDGTASAPRDVLVGLPNGVHQTNQLAFGPDGLLYVANGSTSDSGWSDEPSYPAGDSLPVALAQPAEQQPLSGSILRLDPDLTRVRPDGRQEVFFANRYRGNGRSEQESLDVVATGMRNNFGIEFVGDDLYVTLNGPNPMHHNDTVGDDLLLRVPDATQISLADGSMVDFGWPGCLYANDGSTGRGGRPIARTPERPDKLEALGFDVCHDDDGDGVATGAAGTTPPLYSFGPHASADGIAVGPAEWGPDFEGDLFVAMMSGGDGVARVNLAEDGTVATRGDGGPDVDQFATSGGIIDAVVHDGVLYLVRFAEGALFGPATIWTVQPEGEGGGGVEPPALPDPSSPPAGAPVIVAGPGSQGDGYTTPDAIAVRGTPVQFLAAGDTQPHNVVARDSGPAANPWCGESQIRGRARDGGCPRFASTTVLAGQSEVRGAPDLPPGTYDFYCTIHGSSMEGTLTVI